MHTQTEPNYVASKSREWFDHNEDLVAHFQDIIDSRSGKNHSYNKAKSTLELWPEVLDRQDTETRKYLRKHTIFSSDKMYEHLQVYVGNFFYDLRLTILTLLVFTLYVI